jgi:hypothetical protein
MPQLPLLPGNSFSQNAGKDKYHKSHHFDYTNDVAMLVGSAKPGIGGEPLAGQSKKIKPQHFSKGRRHQRPRLGRFRQAGALFRRLFSRGRA